MKTVYAADAEGWNISIFQLFGSGPLWTIKCGECGSYFRKRILVIDNPRVKCSLCGTINIVPVYT